MPAGRRSAASTLGRYPEVQDSGHGFRLFRVDRLIDRNARDRFFGTSSPRAYQAEIRKATAGNGSLGDPCPCGGDGAEVILDASDPRLKAWLPTCEGDWAMRKAVITDVTRSCHAACL